MHYSDSQYCLSETHSEIARAAGFKWFGSTTASFGKHQNTGEYFVEGMQMMIPALFKEGGTGSSETQSAEFGDEESKRIWVKELLNRLFIENPSKFRDKQNLSPSETPTDFVAAA